MKQERTTRFTGRFKVLDTAGRMHTVEEHGDFVRVQTMDGIWSDWARSGGRMSMNGQHVNPTNDPQVFELAMTGEKLTAVIQSE